MSECVRVEGGFGGWRGGRLFGWESVVVVIVRVCELLSGKRDPKAPDPIGRR